MPKVLKVPKMPKVVVRLRRANFKVTRNLKKVKISSAEGAFLNFRHFNIL